MPQQFYVVSPQLPALRQYAFVRALDAGAGELIMSGALYAFGYPMVEVAIRVLRTPKGSLPHNPLFGTDYSIVDNAAPNAGANFQAAIVSAFDYYTKLQLMTQLRVLTQVTGNMIIADVGFYDPRARLRFTIASVPSLA